MELHFHTPYLRDICEKRPFAIAELGYDAARELAARIADFEVVDNVEELVELLGSTVADVAKTTKSLLLISCRILFTSAELENLADPLVSPDWSKTRRVMIIALEKNDE